MNPAYHDVIAASDVDRNALFAGAAARLGTPIPNVEKDFWVCWTLDVLFNGLDPASPRLLFKGGTSLSKAFGLIPRFSEDIDITVFREDIGQAVEAEALDALSGKQRRARLDAIRDACRAYLNGPFADQVRHQMAATGEQRLHLEADPDDPNGQTFLLRYPAADQTVNTYIRSAVKIEAGAKSALDPHTAATINPYLAEDLPERDLRVANVITVEAERTFWDKIIITHGLHQWFGRRGELRHGGQRVSRHYYDIHQMMRHAEAAAWPQNQALGASCATHARLFFGSPDLGLDLAHPGAFTLMPPEPALRADYTAMAGMIFGPVPEFEEVLNSIAKLERQINGAS